jgi:hypothetical protein
MLVGMDCSFPKSHYTSFLDSRFKSYEVSKDFTQSLGMQSDTANAANSGQNCQNLPNLPKDGTLKYHQKLKL